MQKLYPQFKNSTRHNLNGNQYIDQKEIVDINKLLNRVKIDKKNEAKQQIIFFGIGLLILTLMTVFLVVIK